MRPTALLLCTLALACTACSEDDDTAYPDMLTDLVMAIGNSEGVVEAIQTDDGQRLTLENRITGIPANARVRSLCDYVITADGRAIAYSIAGVPVLARVPDGEGVRTAPTGVAAVWQSGGFVNLHLLPKTQGGLQNWAFAVDSARANSAGGTTHYLSLYHDQAADKLSYTGHVYASIDPDSIAVGSGQPAIDDGQRPAGNGRWTTADSMSLTINTFSGPETWHFSLRP